MRSVMKGADRHMVSDVVDPLQSRARRRRWSDDVKAHRGEVLRAGRDGLGDRASARDLAAASVGLGARLPTIAC